jgi:hypothetical protein
MTDLTALLDQFVPTPISCDESALSDDVRAALPHVVAAMRGVDAIFHRQVGPQVVELFETLGERDPDSALVRAVRHFNGPYDKLAGHAPIVDGVEPAPAGRALYPADMPEAEFDAWIADHPDDKEAFLSPYTVIARTKDGGLAAVPYTSWFAEELAVVATELRKASALVEHEGLKTFLASRANALQGEYPLRDSDADWVRLVDAPLEVVIGPFEVYEDGLKGLKAFYEGMLFRVDFESGARLKQIEDSLDILAKEIPVPAGSRPALGGMAPMVVAEEIIATGDGYSGILASAFNLPNDPWVRGEVGWKQVMIKNVMQAKFDNCTARIAQAVLSPDQAALAGFEAYFFFVLLHEVTHGLGPAYRADGRSCNEACGKYYTPIEEAKADTGALVLMIEKNGTCGIPEIPLQNIAASYLAGLYRSARFGLHEAHGKANVVQYSWFRRQGVLVPSGDGERMMMKVEAMPAAAHALLDELCRLEAEGTEAELIAFLDDYGTVLPEFETAIAGLGDIPVDIIPQYVV